MPDDSPKVHPNNEREDPLVADSRREAIAVSQWEGRTMIIGDEQKEEWLWTDDLGPLPVEEYR